VQICSVCLPLKNEYFKVYSWKENSWNLVFILETIIGGSIAGFLLMDGTQNKYSCNLNGIKKEFDQTFLITE
jgi:hypothetical protein|tara:strand:+ start:126 stop:341 length:216 start_codon:yes stop_codon:yes gene_type:complete